MKLIIDGSEQTIDLQGAKTVEDAFSVLKDSVANDRIIVEILLDGEHLTAETEKHFMGRDIEEVKMISITTDTPNDLAKKNLAEASEYLDAFNKQIDDVIEVLQVGGEEDTYDIFVDGLKGLEEVLNLVDVVKTMLGFESADLVVDGEEFGDYVDNIAETLKEFKAALEDEDLVYMQDLLQYELKTALDTLKEYLKIIDSKLA